MSISTPPLVWHVSLKRKLRVVVLVNRKDPDKPRYIVLASTALELHGHKLVAVLRGTVPDRVSLPR